MSAPTDNLSGMAFTTRTGRTVAVDTGAMTTAVVLTVLSMFLLLLPLSVAIGFVVLLFFPESRDVFEQPISYALAYAITGLGFLILLRAIALTCMLTAFIGPKNDFRDHLSAMGKSRTAQFAALSALITVALMIAMRFPFGTSRAFVVVFLTVALIWIDVAIVRGLWRLGLTSRRRAYYAGMSEEQKQRADRPRAPRVRPSFPDPKVLTSAPDAARYQRRADEIAELHTWIGAGIIVIFTAFVGTSIAAFLEGAGPVSAMSMYVVLGFIGLGFWIQRRARGYRTLSADFNRRCQEIELDEAERTMENSPGLMQRWAAFASRISGRA